MSSIISRITTSKLFRSFFITSFGSGISKVIMILGTFYCTNTLTKMEFGEYSFIRNTLTMLLTICASNFSSLCTKFAAEASTSIASLKRLFILFLFSLVVCTVAGGLLLMLPSNVILSILGTTESIEYFRFAGMLLPLFMVQPLIEGTLRGRMHFKLISWLQIISSVLFVALLISGIRHSGVAGAIWGLYIYYGLYSILSIAFIFYADKPLRHLQSLDKFWLEYRAIFKMVLPVFVLSFVEAPIFWYMQAILAEYASIEAVGTMTVVKQIRNLALLVPNYFFMTYIAFAGRLNAEKQYVQYFSQFDRLIKLFGLGGIAITVILSIFAKLLLSLFGSIYVTDWPILIVGCVGIPISLMMSLIKQSLILQEHQIQLMYISIFWNIIWVALFYVMVLCGCDVIYSFFISETLAWGINITLSYIIYYRDKKKILCQ